MRRILILLLLFAIVLGSGLLWAAAMAGGSEAPEEVDLTWSEPPGETNDRIDSEDPSEDDVTRHDVAVCEGDTASPAAPSILPLPHARSLEPVHPPPRA